MLDSYAKNMYLKSTEKFTSWLSCTINSIIIHLKKICSAGVKKTQKRCLVYLREMSLLTETYCKKLVSREYIKTN